MAEAATPGILVEESPGRETALEAFPDTACAFVGAAPRGPLNRAVLLSEPEEYDRVFGFDGTEHAMQQCVRDFFLAGGQRAAVVRVANGARACLLHLPGRDGTLVLEALSPGRREYLRASVDYDQIGASDELSFNLVVQRLRSPGTERVVDQEIYHRLSLRPGSERYVTDVLMSSKLVRVQGAPPSTRPAATVSTAPGYPVAWVDADDNGSDGKALTDYDLVGSAVRGSGLFALDDIGPVDLVCLPPGAQPGGAGPTLLVAALRYCRLRGALLLLEPPAGTFDGEQALGWLKGLNIGGEHAVAVFPPLSGDGPSGARSALGAAAGALMRAPAASEPALGGIFRPTHELSPDLRRRLQAAGINVIGRGAGGRITLAGDRTLASAECAAPAWRSLVTRRLGLAIERTLLHGTRWVVFEPSGPALAERLREQLGNWLESLRFAGRLVGSRTEAWFVDVNEVTAPLRPPRVEFTVGFAPQRPGEFIIYRVSQGLRGARLAAISPERWAISQPATLSSVSAGGAREAG